MQRSSEPPNSSTCPLLASRSHHNRLALFAAPIALLARDVIFIFGVIVLTLTIALTLIAFVLFFALFEFRHDCYALFNRLQVLSRRDSVRCLFVCNVRPDFFMFWIQFFEPGSELIVQAFVRAWRVR